MGEAKCVLSVMNRLHALFFLRMRFHFQGSIMIKPVCWVPEQEMLGAHGGCSVLHVGWWVDHLYMMVSRSWTGEK